MKLSRKQLRKFILKEFKDQLGQFTIDTSPPDFGGGGGINLPPEDHGEGRGPKLTPCENTESSKYKISEEIVYRILSMSMPNGVYDAHPNLVPEEYIEDMPVYIIQDITTDFCKGYFGDLNSGQAETNLFKYLKDEIKIRNYTDEYLY